MSLEEFVKHALSDIAAGLNKAIVCAGAILLSAVSGWLIGRFW